MSDDEQQSVIIKDSSVVIEENIISSIINTISVNSKKEKNETPTIQNKNTSVVLEENKFPTISLNLKKKEEKIIKPQNPQNFTISIPDFNLHQQEITDL